MQFFKKQVNLYQNCKKTRRRTPPRAAKKEIFAMEKKIKLGVFGAGRGAYLAAIAAKAGFELTGASSAPTGTR